MRPHPVVLASLGDATLSPHMALSTYALMQPEVVVAYEPCRQFNQALRHSSQSH